MTTTPPPTQLPRMAKIQAELVDLSARLNTLAHDFQQLAAELPRQVGAAETPLASPGNPAMVTAPPQAPPRLPDQAPPPMLPQGAYPQPPVGRPPQPTAYPQPPAGRPQPAAYPPPPPGSRPAMPAGAASVAFTPAARPARPRRQISIAEIFAVVGSAITLLGVAFVLLLPDQAVMPDLVRAGIGLGLALTAVGVALVQHWREPSNIGSQALMATGVAAAFLTVMALSTLFRDASGAPLLPPIAGTIVAGLISLGGVAVARWWRSEWLAVLAVLGALILAPYLAGRDPLWPMAFMLVMTAATAAFQHKVDWVGLLLARFLPTSLYFLWALAVQGVGIGVQWGLMLSFLLAAAGVAIATQHQYGSPRMQAMSLGAMVTMSAPLVVAIFGADRVLSSELAAAFGVMMVAAGLMPRVFEPQVRATAVPLGALFVVLAVIRFNDGHYLGYLFFTLAAAYFAVAAKTKYRPMLVVGVLLASVGVSIWFPSVGYAFAPLPGADLEITAQSVLGLVAVLLGLRALRAFGADGDLMVYSGWVSSVIFGSMAMITGGMLIAERTGAEISQGFQTAHALVTVAWILASVWLLRRGLRKQQDSAASVRIAIALAATAVAKLFFFDLRTLPDLVRALAFLAVGVLMLIIGTWYHKQLERGRRQSAAPTEAAPPAVPEK